MVTVDVLIIGGGPHALTIASLLSSPNTEPRPNDPAQSSWCSDSTKPTPDKRCCSVKRKKGKTKNDGLVSPQLSLLVVDSYGEWTTLWESQFTALSIPHLRSHTLVHTDPLNKHALQEFILKTDRSAELHRLQDQVYILDENAFFSDMRLGKKEKKRLNVTSSLKKSLSFSLPGTTLSVDFFKDQVRWVYNLDKVMLKGTVENIIPVVKDAGSIKQVKHFKVQLQDGTILQAKRVVIATGPSRAQMANIPSWVKNIGEAYPEERLQHTVELMHYLSKSKQTQTEVVPSKVCEKGHRVMVVGGGLTSKMNVPSLITVQVSEAVWCYKNQVWSLSLSTGDHWTGDKIWLATGCKLDVNQDPLLSGVMKEFPVQVIDGWPCITEGLQWAEGCPLYLMGQYTALQVGPHAVNLAGGQAASVRIAKDIRQQKNPADPRNGEKSKTEDYIQHMHGLLWL
uniref:Zgc:113276 n=1 Tax=Cynoglossus semilaevis TaxID=244447 RepID=A0A3P8UEA6_CYNSE